MIELAPDIYVETGFRRITVGAVLTSEGWVCMDTPPHPDDAQRWRDTLKAISPQPVRYVISTDYHRDHILGNAWFEAPLVAQATSAAQMLQYSQSFVAQAADELKANESDVVKLPSQRLRKPEISFTTMLTLYCSNRLIELQSRPSATLGSLWVVLKDSKIIFAGDSVITGQHPIITNGVSKPWLDALRWLRLERHRGWRVVTGRGGVIAHDETGELSEYLRVARRRISSLCRADRPRSEVAQLVSEFMDFFPYDSAQKEETQRQVRAGLEAIYDEMRAQVDPEGSC
jgi:glyoxylase-like metal-dependent hydrolase (beta-lactamase superfamily II)